MSVFHARFIKGFVVRHERQPFDFRLNLVSNIGENRGFFGVFGRQSVDARVIYSKIFTFTLRQDFSYLCKNYFLSKK